VRRLSFFLRLAIPVQLTLAVSGKGQARTWQQACFEMAYTAD